MPTVKYTADGDFNAANAVDVDLSWLSTQFSPDYVISRNGAQMYVGRFDGREPIRRDIAATASDGVYADFSDSFGPVRIDGSNKGDVLRGGPSDDSASFTDGRLGYIWGWGGDDVLEGGPGADELNGGSGKDTASYQHASKAVKADLTTPSVNSGDAKGDTYVSIENLLGSSHNDVLLGDDHANSIDGGAGADKLYGRGGNDTFYVDDAADRIYEAIGQGADTVIASVSYVLTPRQSIEVLETSDVTSQTALNLTGNALTQTIFGNAGANVIRSGGGGDKLVGMGGDDTYVVSDAADKVIEAADGGRDRVATRVSYKLAAGQSIEVLETTGTRGTTALSLTGNEQNQTIRGNAGDNVIDGAGGRDTLKGMGGHDTFRLASAPASANLVTITDFNTTNDAIALSHSVFAAAGGVGVLAASAFSTGSAAATADSRIIYNSGTGALFYDIDGVGSAKQIEFAKLSAGLDLTSANITIV